MDVRASPSGTGSPGGKHQTAVGLPTRPGSLSGKRVGDALGEWQASELRLARSFAECRGLSHEQLEDLYQETALVLLGRSFQSGDHLRHALRWGIKHRALHMHRDERRRGEILIQRAPELQMAAQAREHERTPELAALLDDDRRIVSEFLSELSHLERRVFWLTAEGLRYRAIAPMLGIPINDARKASRSCERKRERFQLLYDTGRLCGYRSQTILAMQAGESVSDELAARAYAHLRACASCRAEHKTSAQRLRSRFHGQAAALLPIPVLAGHLSRITRLELRARSLAQRLLAHTPAPGTGLARERALAILASGGASAKVAAGVATVAVIAGGTIGATHAIEHPTVRHHRRAPSDTARAARAPSAAVSAVAVQGARSELAEQRIRDAAREQAQTQEGARKGKQHEPGGFAYLGVPTGGPPNATSRARASSASTNSRVRETVGEGADEQQTGGGPFSP